jgi:hypothetical protein
MDKVDWSNPIVYTQNPRGFRIGSLAEEYNERDPLSAAWLILYESRRRVFWEGGSAEEYRLLWRVERRIIRMFLENDKDRRDAKMSSSKHNCECTDPGCPVHKGSYCANKSRTITVYRVDMEDKTGTRMCRECANDALDSGVFRSERE